MSLLPYELQLYSNYSSFRAHKWLLWSASPCLLAVGTVGNALAVWVLWQGSKRSSTFAYLLALGLADEITLLAGLLRQWLLHVSGLNVSLLGRGACISGHLVTTSATYLSVLLIVAVTVERVGMVQQKAVRPYSTSVAKARAVCCLLAAACLLANAHLLFILDLYDYRYPGTNVTEPVCDIRPQYQQMKEELAWLDSALYCFAPFSIIMVCNCRIICVLRAAGRPPRLAKEVVEMSALRPQAQSCAMDAANARNFNRNFRQVTVTLLSVSGLFLLTALPITALKVVTSLRGFASVDADDYRFQSRYLLAQTCCELLMYANHSSNFFLYCLCGKKFRRQLKEKLAAVGIGFFREAPAPVTTHVSDRHA